MISATLSLNNIYSLHTSLTYIYKYARTHIAALQRHSCQHGAHAHLVCTPLETLFPTFNKMGFYIYIHSMENILYIRNVSNKGSGKTVQRWREHVF